MILHALATRVFGKVCFRAKGFQPTLVPPYRTRLLPEHGSVAYVSGHVLAEAHVAAVGHREEGARRTWRDRWSHVTAPHVCVRNHRLRHKRKRHVRRQTWHVSNVAYVMCYMVRMCQA
jgi:hypothetical protein